VILPLEIGSVVFIHRRFFLTSGNDANAPRLRAKNTPYWLQCLGRLPYIPDHADRTKGDNNPNTNGNAAIIIAAPVKFRCFWHLRVLNGWINKDRSAATVRFMLVANAVVSILGNETLDRRMPK